MVKTRQSVLNTCTWSLSEEINISDQQKDIDPFQMEHMLPFPLDIQHWALNSGCSLLLVCQVKYMFTVLIPSTWPSQLWGKGSVLSPTVQVSWGLSWFKGKCQSFGGSRLISHTGLNFLCSSTRFLSLLCNASWASGSLFFSHSLQLL